MNVVSEFVASISLAAAIGLALPDHQSQSAGTEPTPTAAAQAEASFDPYGGLSPVVLSSMTAQERVALRLQNSFGLNEERAKNFAGWVLEVEHTYGVPIVVTISIIKAESDFRYQATSWYGAVGPAQVVPRFWAKQCDGDIVNDPRANILCSGKILDRYFARCEGNVSCTLAAYNTGPHYIHNPTQEMDVAMTIYWDKLESAIRKYEPSLMPQFSHSWRDSLIVADSR